MKSVLAHTAFAALLLTGLTPAPAAASVPTDPLYRTFQSPPAEARPFMRWWWNGNRITEAQIVRELDAMRAAGVGGVEINPIALHEAAPTPTAPAHDWLSPEWIRLLKVAVDGAHARGMMADLIVGSGWPFGGKFLRVDETVQGLVISTQTLNGPQRVTVDLAPLVQGNRDNWALPDAPRPVFRFAHLAPAPATDLAAVRDVTGSVTADLKLTLDVPAGPHQLLVGAVQRGFRGVMHGAPGADGPVLDHFNRAAVRRFLDRMSAALAPSFGGRLGPAVRALFCDSLELSGANWTDDVPAEFLRRRGYPIEPYLAFVGTKETVAVGGPLQAELRRVRQDFSQTLSELMNERFVGTFVEWCREQGVQSRYQAYGMPALYDMHAGYLLPDIPEGDMWIYNNWMGLDNIRYAFFNKYASSAGHQRGRRLIGCEAMTNTRGVFRELPQYFKQAGDLNLLTGVNHNILHGWNYTPPEAGFPGWVRYGCYFNPVNPWWPAFREWMDYQARLCAVLQNSQPVAEVAILGPTADVWAQHGLDRGPIIATPPYLHELWQAFSAHGTTADYIGEGLLAEADAADGELRTGPMRYQLLLVVQSEALAPATVRTLEKFARSGGRIAFVGRVPDRASGAGAHRDREVGDALAALVRDHAKSIAVVAAPRAKQPLLPWAGEVLTRFGVRRAVTLTAPDERLMQIHHRVGEREVFFFANVHRERTIETGARFATTAPVWRWDATTGARHAQHAPDAAGIHALRLAPLESLLLVLDPAAPAASAADAPRGLGSTLAPLAVLPGPWQVSFGPMQGEKFSGKWDNLENLTKSTDARVAAFAGEVVYRTSFDFSASSAREEIILDLGQVHGTAEVRLNGRSLGHRWWGQRRFDLTGAVTTGRNELEIVVGTALFNYVRSLRDNPMARAWTEKAEPGEPSGLLGPVRILAATASKP
jgi:hypothetical protein